MELEGTFTNGVVVPDVGSAVPDEVTRVKIVPNDLATDILSGPTLDELLSPLIVDTDALPTDYALNHEYHCYGRPKQ